jgi:hypothetical protein
MRGHKVEIGVPDILPHPQHDLHHFAGIVRASAAVAQLLALIEIHWSFSYGKPLSK